MKNLRRLIAVALYSSATAAVTGLGVQAAQAADTTTSSAASGEAEASLPEIIVTANKREERLQDVPVSVNEIDARSLTNKGIAGTNDLQQVVPGLDYSPTGPSGTPFLRGIGSNAANPNDEPSIATYVDGVYLAAPFGDVFNFNNVDRIEVLKGPQSTLFGRNTVGGVINVITRDPTQHPVFDVSLGYGNFNTATGSLYAAGGLAPNLAADIAFQFQRQGNGYGENVTTHQDIYLESYYAFRDKVVYTPSDKTKLTLGFDFRKGSESFSEYKLIEGEIALDGTPQDVGLYNTRGNIVNREDTTAKGLSLKIEQDVDFARFVSITAARKNNGFNLEDPDTVSLNFVDSQLYETVQTLTQEFQLLSQPSSPLKWLVGVFGYYNRSAYEPGSFQSGLAFGLTPGTSGTDQVSGEEYTHSASAYGQASYDIIPGTTVTAGLRYSADFQKYIAQAFLIPPGIFIGGPTNTSQDDHPVTGRFAIDQKITDAVNVYASYNRGTRSGGYDLLGPTHPGYLPETVNAYEVGEKSEWLDRRVRFNAALFWDDYSNIQVQVIPGSGQSGSSILTLNAASARIKGADVDFEVAPIPHLTFNGGLSLLDGAYSSFKNAVEYGLSPLQPSAIVDDSGKTTIRTPHFTGNIGVKYDMPTSYGDYDVSANLYHNSGFAWAADGSFNQNPYNLLNASAGWTDRSGHYGVQVWGKNLNNDYYELSGVPSGLGGLMVPAPPRTFGISISYRYE